MAEMAERGLDMAAHRSKNIDEASMDHADLVLVMTGSHAEALAVVFPRQTGKVHLLSSTVGEIYDIADPYGGTRLEYAQTARELEALIEAGYDRIVALAESCPEA
jgi:protein-tyrosine phosphatase